MPLIGHTFAGLVTASVVTHTRDEKADSPPGRLLGNVLAPLAVAFAYLPDFVSQVLTLAGYRDGRLFGHSLAAAGATATIGCFLLRRCGLSNSAAMALPLGGLASHLTLDLLQSPDLRPWWPFSERPLLSDPLLPGGWAGEAIIAVALLLTWGMLQWRRGSLFPEKAPAQNPPKPISSVFSALLVVVIVAVAISVFLLRDVRERQLERARQFVETGRIEEGFILLDKADRWPATARPGRIDYYRGVGHLQRGERHRAEECFLTAYRDAPRFLWVLFDLAVFYAEEPRPIEERKELAAPYLRSLAEDFPNNQVARDLLIKARRRWERERALPRQLTRGSSAQ